MATRTSYTSDSTQSFGFSLLAKLSRDAKNLCISPISIDLCLQLALYGAYGMTAAEIIKAAGISATNPEALAEDANRLIESLNSSKASSWDGPGASVKVMLANSAWFHHTVKLHPHYLSGLQQKYKAECANLNFADGRALEIINGWVAQHTENRISSIISQLSPANMLVLVNCAYFKARWAHMFERSDTAVCEFFVDGEKPMPVKTMRHQHTGVQYFQDEAVQIARLQYVDDRFAMYVVLPARSTSLSKVIADLTLTRWNGWRSNLRPHAGAFSIPKFKLEFGLDLVSTLQFLGITAAFTQQADFRNILDPNQEMPPFFHIGQVIHKTFIEVDEEGTEAAAATAIMMWGCAPPPPPPPFEMIVDRPFLYIITDDATGTVLFLGTVSDPRA